MMIGGHDTILYAPAQTFVADVILRTCKRHWVGSECCFQDADDERIHSLTDPWVWISGSASREFFVYRDQIAADDWTAHGAVKKNANSMLHFIIRQGRSQMQEITVVCDRLTPDVRRFLADLKDGFLSGAVAASYMSAAGASYMGAAAAS